jgi:hypothetical protein
LWLERSDARIAQVKESWSGNLKRRGLLGRNYAAGETILKRANQQKWLGDT